MKNDKVIVINSKKLFTNMFLGKMTPDQIEQVLVEQSKDGEEVSEILGAICSLRNLMLKIDLGKELLDTCGTGGDGLGTFNISTLTAIVLAGAGVKVAKHGNRKATGSFGSADLLETLGVNIFLSPHDAKKVFEEVGIVFLFAPIYHPMIKIVSPIRSKMGNRTIFNLIGPFCNPTQSENQMIGVPNMSLLKKLTEVSLKLDYKRLALLSNPDGLDEVSIVSPTTVNIICGKSYRTISIEPKKYGMNYSNLDGVKATDQKSNVKIFYEVLNGQVGARRDIVLLNAGLGLHLLEKAKDLEEGIVKAKNSIDSGMALKTFVRFIKISNKYEKITF